MDRKLTIDRMKICKACPSSVQTWGVGLTCGTFGRPSKAKKTCGCILKAKTAMKNQRCPQGKW